MEVDRMRVLHLTRDYPPRHNGGLSSAVPRIVAHEASVGIDTHVASFDAWRPRGKPTAAALSDAPRLTRLRSRTDLAKLRNAARGFAPDLIHLHDALLLSHAHELELGCPIAYTVHVMQDHLRYLRGIPIPTRSEIAQREAFASAAILIAPSAATANALPQATASRTRIIPFSVEASAPRTVGDGTILFVGRFVDIKGIDTLLAAIPRVCAMHPEARFILAGGLPDSPRATARFRERLSSAPEAAQARTELVGWCSPEALSGLYARASILVAPSWAETYGLAIDEALAHGLAIVATDLPAIRERVRAPDEGILVAPRDADAVTHALVELLASPSRRVAIQKAAAERFDRRDVSKLARARARAYRDALVTPSKARPSPVPIPTAPHRGDAY